MKKKDIYKREEPNSTYLLGLRIIALYYLHYNFLMPPENISLVMNEEEKKQLRSDFEKYMRQQMREKKNFTLEDFVSFSSSLINFSFSSYNQAEKEKRTDYLLGLFNAGIGNRITKDDQIEIRNLILSDPHIDFQIINFLYDKK